MINEFNYDYLISKLNNSKDIDIMKVSPNEVDNIKDIVIDKEKTSYERILNFLNCVKNPYIFNVDGCIVKIEFSNNNIYADNCITNMFKNIYK